MCFPFYLNSLLVICAVAGLVNSHINFFRSTQRERRLTGSSLIVLHLYRRSVFWKRQNACIAFHFNHLDTCIVSILDQLLYASSRLRSARIQFRDWSVSRIVDHIKSKHRVLRSLGTCIVFVLFDTILSRSFCVRAVSYQ